MLTLAIGAAVCMLMCTALPHHHSYTSRLDGDWRCSVCQLHQSFLLDLPGPIVFPCIAAPERVEHSTVVVIAVESHLSLRLRAPPA